MYSITLKIFIKFNNANIINNNNWFMGGMHLSSYAYTQEVAKHERTVRVTGGHG